MHDDDANFSLTVTIPAGDWAFTRRRLTYLEAILLQILHDPARIKEWFGATELAALQLRGLPKTRQGISRLAKVQYWRCRAVPGQGGFHHEYHCTALPEAAFTDLLGRMVASTQKRAAVQDTRPSFSRPTSNPLPPAENTAPPWVLPLLRIIRANKDLPLTAALKELPYHLSPEMLCPTSGEAENILRNLGIIS